MDETAEEKAERIRGEKWTSAYQQGRQDGRLDAQFSGRLTALESRMEKLEQELMPKLDTMKQALDGLVSEAKASRSNWQKWVDRAKTFGTFLYRASVFVMFLAVFIRNSDLGKIIAPWIGKWLFP